MIKPVCKSARSTIAIAAAAVFGSSLLTAAAARAGACHDVHITVAPSKADGRSWDVNSIGGLRFGQNIGQPNIGYPDIQPSIDGRTYPPSPEL